MSWLSVNLPVAKDVLSLLSIPVLWLAKLFRHPKTGEYFPVTGSAPPSMDRMVVRRSFQIPIKLFALGDDFEMVVVDHSADYREAEFRVRCHPLDHDVAVAKWKPWSENPNCLQLEMVFIESNRTYSQVFRKVRR